LPDSQKVHIVGIGDDGLDGLTATSSQLIAQADLLLGGAELLASVENEKAERIEIGADLDRLVQLIAENTDRRVLILATGDPLFYGTARFLCDRLGKDRFEVVPHVSSMQLAFARVKESWDEAYLTNLANQPLDRVPRKWESLPRRKCPRVRLLAPSWIDKSTTSRLTFAKT